MFEDLDFKNFKDFEEASYTVLEFLQKKVGYSLWMMTRTIGNDWIVLQVKDNYYNVKEGDIFKWCDSFCSKMVLGEGPFVAPNSDNVKIYKDSEIAKYVEIKSYFGIPINNSDGTLFGTLCAIDPAPQEESIKEFLPLVQILGKLLSSMILQDELNSQLHIKNNELAQNINILNNNLNFIKINDEDKIIEVSNKFLEVTNFNKDKILNNKYDEVFLENKSFSFIKNILNNTNNYTEYLEGYRNENEYFYLEFNVVKVKNLKDSSTNFLITYSDITSQKEKDILEVQMIEQYKLASMGEMIGNIAHQWRQPLSAISTVTSTIKLQKQLNLLKDNELYEKIDTIERNTIYLSDTINIFSNYLKQKKDSTPYSLQTILEDSLQIVSAMLENYNIKVIKDFDENEIMTCDMKELLPQAIINLINNAKDALLENKIKNPWIKISLKKFDKKAKIIIEDNAGGIKKELQNKIFEPYFSTKHASLGIGLGLHISYKIIKENLRGSIEVINSDFGAKFTISLDI